MSYHFGFSRSSKESILIDNMDSSYFFLEDLIIYYKEKRIKNNIEMKLRIDWLKENYPEILL